MNSVVSSPAVPDPALVPTLGAEFLPATQSDTAIAPIRTLDECQSAVNERQEIGVRIKQVEAYFRPMKDAAHKAHRAICDRENEVLTPLKALDGKVRLAIQAFSAEQERERRAEQQRQAEQQRREEQDRLAAEAALLEQAGEQALADAVIEQAIATPAPVVHLPTVKQQVVGLKTRQEWKWRYVGGDAGTAMKLIPREYLMPDESRIGKVVRAMKDAAKIPGVEVYSEDVPVR